MKEVLLTTLLITMFFIGGYFTAERLHEPEIRTDTVTVTHVETFADTVFKYRTKTKYVTRTKVDTITKMQHDTTYLIFWSPFRFGNDSTYATGEVQFDGNEFSFYNTKIHCKQKTIYKTKYIIKNKETWATIGRDIGIGIAIGIITELLIGGR